MVDNNQNNDEYQFTEMDSYDNDSMNEMNENTNPSYEHLERLPKKNIKRNALLTIGVIILVMVLYKLIGYLFFSGKNDTVSTTVPATPVTQVTTAAPSSVIPAPEPQPTQQPLVSDSSLGQKVAAMEVSQDSVKAEVNSLNQQISTMDSNINNLNNQITNLNQMISNLSNQLAKQSDEMSMLLTRFQPKPIHKQVVRHRTPVESIRYYLQAIIPGRAWLIGSNGSTITVREGTKINGYGVVKLIDSIQGLVVTSSGRVIKFSQEDS